MRSVRRPSRERAEQLARETDMVIAYASATERWATGDPPDSFVRPRKQLHMDDGRIQILSSRGSHVVHVHLDQGRISFYLLQPLKIEKKIKFLGILLLLCISLLMLAAFLAISWVLRPLRLLKQGVNAVGRGRLAHRVPLKRRDELRDLAEAFNEMTERLGRLIRAKEQLLLDVSHELRTPITRIKVALAMLPEDESHQGIVDDLNEIEAKITELLETARSLGVKAELDRRPVDLEALIRQVIAPYKDQPPGIRVLSMPRHAPVLLDSGQIAKALRNVVDNALKYSPKDSRSVEVAVAYQADQAVISVQDFGVGIPAADVAFVFEPFYRVDKARSPKAGYGLGLSLVRTTVEAHHGYVDLQSTPGHGTTVTIYLPVE